MNATAYDQQDAELLARTIAAREALPDGEIFHPSNCGPCADCLAFKNDFAVQSKGEPGKSDFATAARSVAFTFGKPKFDDLAKHARRFGPAGILEIAALALSPTNAARLGGLLVREGIVKKTESKLKNVPLKEQCASLQERGLTADEIAEALNISVARTRTLLGSSRRA